MAAGGGQQPAQHAEGGGLAGAVRPQQAKDLAARHLERGAGHGGEIAEAAHQVAHHDHRAVAAVPGGRGRLRHVVRPAVRHTRRGRAGVLVLAQHHHERVFQLFRPRLVRDAAQQRVQRARIRVRLADVAHRAALGTASTISASASIRRACRSRAGVSGGGVAVKVTRARRQAAGAPSASRRPWCMTKTWAQRGLVHVGGADDHAQVLVVDQLPHDLPLVAPRQRIDAHAGLVQQQQVRRAHQRAGQPQLLFHAAGQLAGRAAAEARQVGHLQQAGIAFAARRLRTPCRSAYKSRFSCTLRSSYRPKRCGM